MPSGRLGSELTRPLPIAALTLLVLNDQVLKGAHVVPAWLTGKLSDFAGLFLLPVVLFVVIDALTLRKASYPPNRSSVALLAALATVAGFSAVKLWPAPNAWLSVWLGTIRLDATDLVALPAAGCAALWLRRAAPAAAQSRGLTLVAFVAAALACLATSRPQLVRNYPVWRIESLGARRIGCALVDAWVSKSGKQGLGVTLELSPASAGACHVAIPRASISTGGLRVAAATLPPPRALKDRAYFYLPFAFDNQALWNDGVRDARVELTLESGENQAELAFNLRQIWSGPHRMRSNEPETGDASPPPPPKPFAEPPP